MKVWLDLSSICTCLIFKDAIGINKKQIILTAFLRQFCGELGYLDWELLQTFWKCDDTIKENESTSYYLSST
jgi:hypothetical protein